MVSKLILHCINLIGLGTAIRGCMECRCGINETDMGSASFQETENNCFNANLGSSFV